VGAAHPALVGQLEDPLGARVERPVDRMPEPGQPFAGVVDGARDLLGDRSGILP
jgi:hypothetical protein